MPTLLDLPPEILIKIVEHECLDLTNRALLGLTCKAMDAIVADSTFYADLYSRTIVTTEGEPVEELELLRTLNQRANSHQFQKCGGASYSCLINQSTRLFRRIHFDRIEIEYGRNSNAEELLLLPESLSCNHLKIGTNDYDPRFFDVVAKISVANELNLDIGGQVEAEIDQQLYQNLPCVPVLRITTYANVSKVSDATILALLSKKIGYVHVKNPIFPFLELEQETLLKALRLTAEHGNYLKLEYLSNWSNWSNFFAALSSHDIGFDGNKLECYSAKATVTEFPRSSYSKDYVIEIDGATISVPQFASGGPMPRLTVIVGHAN